MDKEFIREKIVERNTNEDNQLKSYNELIVKIIITFIVISAVFLVVLVVYKIAIEKKIIFRLSNYL